MPSTTPQAGRRAVLALGISAVQVFGSRIAGQAAGVLAAVVAARVLGPEAFGQYSFALVAALLMAQFPGTGLDIAVVRASAGLRVASPERARGVLLVAGGGKLALGACVALAALAVTAPGAAHNESLAGLARPLRAAALAALGLAATEFGVAALQAHERFDRILTGSLATAALRLLPILTLALAGALSLENALAAFVATTFAGAAVIVWLAWVTWRGPLAIDRPALLELFGSARWLVAATLLGVVTSNLDVLLLTRVSGAAAGGVYASGRALALPLALLGSALGTVLLPRLSRLPAHAIGAFVRAITVRVALGSLALGAIVLAGAPFAVRLVYGEPYAAAVPVLQLLAAAFLLQAVSWPAVAAVMALDRPQAITAVSAGMLLFVAAGYALAMPSYGATGAAWVYLAGCAACLPIYAFLAARLLRAAVERLGPARTGITPAKGAHG
jgi:O-antigen/teichoic acid export membrane protein